MEKRKLVKPQSDETLENVDVYACEGLGIGCPCDNINIYQCGS